MLLPFVKLMKTWKFVSQYYKNFLEKRPGLFNRASAFSRINTVHDEAAINL